MSIASQKHSGVTLMEVLISIGVISLGIFGVASLIPVAQFKVAEGTSRDRQASYGPSAVSRFRLQMGSPQDWALPNGTPLRSLPVDQVRQALNRGYCIDPLGVLEGGLSQFPANDPSGTVSMPRLTLASLAALPNASAADPNLFRVSAARDIFLLQDDIVFEPPSDQARQPARQFFTRNGWPMKSAVGASLSWFATISPTATSETVNDEFLLSIVISERRAPVLGITEENIAEVVSEFSGELLVQQTVPQQPNQIGLADLRNGDWLLLARPLSRQDNNLPAESRMVYRWTQIIGTDTAADGVFRFSIANNDFFPPQGAAGGFAIFARGVKGVYERTIRLEPESTGLWK